jgi:hypothetical protein
MLRASPTAIYDRRGPGRGSRSWMPPGNGQGDGVASEELPRCGRKRGRGLPGVGATLTGRSLTMTAGRCGLNPPAALNPRPSSPGPRNRMPPRHAAHAAPPA